MSNAGTALMGIGRGEGKTKAEDAAAAAISSPLLDEPIDKAKGIVFNIVGGNDMSLQEVACLFPVLNTCRFLFYFIRGEAFHVSKERRSNHKHTSTRAPWAIKEHILFFSLLSEFGFRCWFCVPRRNRSTNNR